MKLVVLVVAALICLAPAINADPVSSEWAEKWRADIDFAREAMPAEHANLYHTLTPTEFNESLDQLHADVPNMSHAEIALALAKIVVRVNDGHSRLTLPWVEGADFFTGHTSTPQPNHPDLVFGHFPIRLYQFADGVFVRRIGAANAQYAGAQVLAIDATPIAEVLAAVEPLVHRDNDMQVMHLSPSRLVVPEILLALGIIPEHDQAQFELQTVDGKKHTVTLKPVPAGETVDWVDARDAAIAVPLWLRNTDANYWFEYLPEHKTVYCQFNEVYNEGEESLAQFAVRLIDFIAETGAERLVIDVRHNTGGNNGLNRAVIHALIRCPSLRDPGSLFVIAGRATFSAAMMFCVDVERHTPALFVGEPTGSSPNHYGDSRKVQLPNSGLTIRLSSLYWQYSGPRDDRSWIAPHIPVTVTSEDIRQGHDPELAAILGLAPANDLQPQVSWAGRAGEHSIVLHLTEDAGAWSGTIDFPEQGATGLALEDVVVHEGNLRFVLPLPDQSIVFATKCYGNYLIGGAIWEGATHPVVGRRR